MGVLPRPAHLLSATQRQKQIPFGNDKEQDGAIALATNVQIAWLKSMVTPARLTAHEYGVPASVTLSQAILESAWGTSQLARRANNYFGIKVISGQPYSEFPTREVVRGRSVMEQADFAKYPSAIEGFEAHGRLLSTLTRYRPAMAEARAGEIYEFCVGLYQCGYSTEPDYPRRLVDLIREYNLTQYDITPPERPAEAKEAA